MTSNFPQNLNITPSAHPSLQLSHRFSHNAQHEAITQYGIAGRVWESAYLMSLYVDPLPDLEFDLPFPGVRSPRTIIELGSGTGVVSAAIAKVLEAQQDLVIATDLLEVCPLLDRNLSTTPAVLVRPLAWGNDEHLGRISSELFSGSDPRRLTHIICSDLIYFSKLLAPLLRCLIQLTSEPFVQDSPQPMIIISYKATQERAEALESPWYRFGIDEEDDMFISAAHRKPESLGWQLSTNDHDLLNGVHARGNPKTKGDDTFESLLLLSLQ